MPLDNKEKLSRLTDDLESVEGSGSARVAANVLGIDGEAAGNVDLKTVIRHLRMAVRRVGRALDSKAKSNGANGDAEPLDKPDADRLDGDLGFEESAANNLYFGQALKLTAEDFQRSPFESVRAAQAARQARLGGGGRYADFAN